MHLHRGPSHLTRQVLSPSVHLFFRVGDLHGVLCLMSLVDQLLQDLHVPVGSSPRSHSLSSCLLKRKISGEAINLVHRHSVTSLTEFTMSLSLVTGNPKSRVVSRTSMSQVSHILVSQ
jgi:hypothetical protein